MTCEHALGALLDADLPDAIDGTTPLAAHVRGCARCRRVADQLMADTRLLANAMPVLVASRRRVPARVFVMAPAAVAAMLLVMLTVRRQETATVARVVEMPLPVAVDAPGAATIEPVRRTVVTPRVVAARMQAFPRPISVAAAVKLEPPAPAVVEPVVSDSRALLVTPAAGERAVVMNTGNPKLVVVWLY
jgi:hypothetical protein